MIFLTPRQYRQLKRNAMIDGLLTDPENYVSIEERQLVCLHAGNVAIVKSLPKTEDGFEPLDFFVDDTFGGIDYVRVQPVSYLWQILDFILPCCCPCCRYRRED